MRSPSTSAILRAITLPVVVLVASAATVALSETDQEAKLERIQIKIRELEKNVRRDTAERDKMVVGLRDAELEVARVARTLKSLEQDRAAAVARLGDLNAQREDEELQIARERDVLAGQLKAAYMNGREERLKLLLNQQDPATLGRLMVYYSYLSRARADTIQRVRARVQKLIALAEETVAETARIKDLETREQRRLDELEQARERRSGAVAGLDSRIKQASSELARLQDEERTLTALIDDLRRALQEFPVNTEEPFEDLRGKLAWPIKGKLLKDFGQPRAEGRLKWNGVLVSGDRGAPVRALYHGRVAYADWLPGMGLLVVVEHGDGYLSLYGHNETLLRGAGEWVAPGDVIASVGDSGGRPEPALYFEIRKGTRPLNPHRWIGPRLSSR